MASDTILLEYDGPVAIMTNNRPDKHNAVDLGMFDELGVGHMIIWTKGAASC